MRRFLFACLGLIAAASLAAADPRPATEEEVVLLKEAMKSTAQDTEHWAYTQTITVRDKKGKVREERVVRFDPSKPYAEQYTPLKIDGKPPSARQLRKYRKEGEERGEKLMRSAAARAKKAEGQPPQLTINDRKAALDVDHPLVAEDTEGRMVFEIPVRADPKLELPVDKFQILIQVGKSARQVERAMLRVREEFRLKVIAKIRSGEASVDFAVVDPAYGPLMTTMTGNFGASLFFVPVNFTALCTRTDWKRVPAYDERFNVKLAPLELIGF